MDLSLYRIKAFLPPLFKDPIPPATAVRRAVEQKPTTTTGLRGGRWHIGNVQSVDTDGVYFALGRITKAAVPVLDPVTGNFVESSSETAPYTHVLLDVPSEVCGIGKKSSLAPNPEAMGRYLAKVLEASEVARQYDVRFEVSPLSDPEEFLEILRAALNIRRFTVTFTRPNPFDADEDFHKPMSRLVQAAGGESGSATLKGEALAEGTLEDLTRSVAATGDNASARVQLEPGHRPVTRSLVGGTASLSTGDLDVADERPAALAKLRALYAAIRGKAAS